MASKSETMRVRLLNELMRTRDFQRMLDLARPVFGNPLILSNGGHSVLAITEEDGIDDPNWHEIVTTRGVPMGVLTYVQINEAYRGSLESRRPVLTGNKEGGVGMLRKTLAVGDSVLGYLDAPLYFGAADEEDVEFFDFVGNLITVEMQKDLGRVNLPDNMLDYFVYDLLEGHLTEPALIRERMDYFGWNLLSKGRAQVVTIRGKDMPLPQDNTRFRRLLERFATTFPSFKTFAYGSELKMLCPVSDAIEMDPAMCRALEELLREENLAAGISRPLIYIDTISDFNRQAERAVELGQRFHPDRVLHFYDAYAMYYALELAGGKESMDQFCHSAVTLLRDYDRAHETALLRSLRVYLTHDRSIGESAAALYIHRNTMNYRIARINELTGLDMSDPDVFCHLLFSFYAMDYGDFFRSAEEEKRR